MYRLMKSEKFTLDHVIYGSMASYRQIQVEQFQAFNDAISACEAANENIGKFHYILNDNGKEYYSGVWID